MRPRIPVWITEDDERSVALLKGAPLDVRRACDFAGIQSLWSASGHGYVVDLGRVPDFAVACEHLRISYRHREPAS